MSFEIERKFLVLSDTWRNSVIRHTRIRQAYLDSNAKVSIRVRIKDDSSATLTLKSRSSKLRRREFKYVDFPVQIAVGNDMSDLFKDVAPPE